MSNRRLGWKIALPRIVGMLFCVAGLAAGYIWFCHLGPLRRIADPTWCHRHSQAALWEECETCITRTGWPHDTGRLVGWFGGKQWAQRIVDAARSDDDLVGCRAGHKDHALRLMTNQDAGKSAAAWQNWWQRNKSKSQEDWIREGFRKYGVLLQTPLTAANTVALLKLAARLEEEKGGAPDYIQYNAFHWLRDSDFDPATFSVNDIPGKDVDRVVQGLVRFADLRGQYPKDAGLGVLNLGKPNSGFDFRPMITTPQSRILANTIIFGSGSVGLLLLGLSFRLKRRKMILRENTQVGG
jgi:hypothetical protein